MHATNGSSVPRRQLGRLLTKLREDAQVTIESAADELDCSRQKIWRIERGLTAARGPDVRVLCELYRANQEQAAVLLGLTELSKAEGWWHAYGRSIPIWFSLYIGLENVARQVRYYNAELVPGILQTPGYATALFLHNRPELSEEERKKIVSLRIQRQGLLARRLPPAPDLTVVLSEAVLRRPVPGRPVMAEQLRHLLAVGERSNITVRVLPLAAGPPLAAEAGTFVLLDFPTNAVGNPSEPPTVYVEGLTGALYLDQPEEIIAYERVWSGLESLALDERQSMELIDAILGECYE
ncbi:helix-turn-helix domain-containing protein [Micromonospora yangpuensis]|uniref:Helix-turn-helix domain-containing protein n=1 Tax=Micromonospora yangpuensis TaxID=683228 RepID=A0A1C6U621_9ACTN|nr:helix-turn-helix transcriptional regulator [Micromonospora yangpuensis]GGL91339.1 transcriptional regulator [Micromonospora yangpuensis]SCL49424.1 Helix-turn-helix domain-containing protein [Micromonospora yangpuensis]